MGLFKRDPYKAILKHAPLELFQSLGIVMAEGEEGRSELSEHLDKTRVWPNRVENIERDLKQYGDRSRHFRVSIRDDYSNGIELIAVDLIRGEEAIPVSVSASYNTARESEITIHNVLFDKENYLAEVLASINAMGASVSVGFRASNFLRFTEQITKGKQAIARISASCRDVKKTGSDLDEESYVGSIEAGDGDPTASFFTITGRVVNTRTVTNAATSVEMVHVELQTCRTILDVLVPAGTELEEGDEVECNGFFHGTFTAG